MSSFNERLSRAPLEIETSIVAQFEYRGKSAGKVSKTVWITCLLHVIRCPVIAANDGEGGNAGKMNGAEGIGWCREGMPGRGA